MIEDAMTLTEELRLVGLVSFDFLGVDGAPVLLEINPRPSATLDILDGAHGAMFRAHVAACLGEGSVCAHAWRPTRSPTTRGPSATSTPIAARSRYRPASSGPTGSPTVRRLARACPRARRSPRCSPKGAELDVAVRRLGERSRHLETMLYPEQNKRQ